LITSLHDPEVVYYGGNKLFRSRNRGHSWEAVSPDLTKNLEWKKIPIMGIVRSDDTLSRDDGVDHYGTLTTISESPVEAGLIYIGTDDGNVQMTADGGKTWEDLTKRFRLPGDRWVTRVLASSYGAGIAYVSFPGTRTTTSRPTFKTTDEARPEKHRLRPSPEWSLPLPSTRAPGPSLRGTGSTVFTIDGAKAGTWPPATFPDAGDDIIVNARENDLILGTHGRASSSRRSRVRDMTPSALARRSSSPARQGLRKRSLPDQGAASCPNPDAGA
jgi:hypothetical protein